MQELEQFRDTTINSEIQIFLNTLFKLLDKVENYELVSDIGLDIIKKNQNNENLKAKLLDTVFSGNDYNVMHYAFCRQLFLNHIIITNEDIHQKLEQILDDVNQNKIKPPIGVDFRCIILATPLIFFGKEIQQKYPQDYTKYCQTIKEIFQNSPKIKRINPEWQTPLNIRNNIYGLMDGNNTFNPDDLEAIKQMAGDPSKIPTITVQ